MAPLEHIPRRYLFLGLFFAALQLVVVVRNLSTDYFSFFWYCDFAPAIFAALFFAKNDNAVKALVNIGLFPQLSYVLAVILIPMFGITPFNFIINFPFTPSYVLPTIAIHLSSAVALLATLHIKPNRKTLLYSFFFLVAIYVVVLIFTPPVTDFSGNYNFIYDFGVLQGFDYYTQAWVLLTFVFVVAPTYFFQHFLYWLHARRKVLGLHFRTALDKGFNL